MAACRTMPERFVQVGDLDHLVRVAVRLLVALVFGAVVGFEREREGKSAGIRTHMLVALGAALFTLVPVETNMEVKDLSRVIQGVVVGIGFLGGGTILQLAQEHRVRGLTSAASIWVTASISRFEGPRAEITMQYVLACRSAASLAPARSCSGLSRL